MSKFEGNKKDYQEQRGKVEDWIWMWRHQNLESFPGFKLRAALKGEPWTVVAGIPRTKLASEGGVEDILEILDQKYGMERQQQKMRCQDDFVRAEREKVESIKDFVSRFDLIFRKCIAV